MKKIIVPIDFSLYSENALRTAATIAKKHNSELIVFHSLELPQPIASIPQRYFEEEATFYHKIVSDKFQDILKKGYLKTLKITFVTSKYEIFNGLNDLAIEENANLIVMGSHGTSGLKEFFVGSNTEKVVRTSDIPILVVKGLPNEGKFDNAIFASDFSDENIVPYQKAKKILSTLNCKLHLLYVNTPRNFLSYNKQIKKATLFLEKTEEDLNLLDKIIYTSDYSIEEGVISYANSKNYDLIIMATHGRKGLDHFLKGSISEDIVNHARLPVMTIKS